MPAACLTRRERQNFATRPQKGRQAVTVPGRDVFTGSQIRCDRRRTSNRVSEAG